MGYTVKAALEDAKSHLTTGTEGLILLSWLLNTTQTHVYAHPERVLSQDQKDRYHHALMRRSQGEPMAYITGHKAFWDLTFRVNTSTLIPRPETELLIEKALTVLEKNRPQKVLDLGTGSGAIACTLAHLSSHWQVVATDCHLDTLQVAKDNAKQASLDAMVFVLSDWFQDLCHRDFDVIISNPPYVAHDDPHLFQGGVCFEPLLALDGGQGGLDALYHIIEHAMGYLKPGGWLLLEHGYDQKKAIQEQLQRYGYHNIAQYPDLNQKDRVSMAQWL